MKEYKRLAQKTTFSLSDVTAITGKENTATSLISRWLKKSYAVRIRRDLYTCINLATGDVISNKYQIATATNKLNQHSILRELVPVLNKGEVFILEESLELVKRFVSDLMIMTDGEKEFIDRFTKVSIVRNYYLRTRKY